MDATDERDRCWKRKVRLEAAAAAAAVPGRVMTGP